VPIAAARNSKGSYLVGGKDGKLGIFDKSGKLLRTFGRRGGGPGEFQSIWRIHVSYRDTILVYDMFARRITVIDPNLTRAVRTFTFDDHRGAIPLHNGSFITSGSVATLRNSGLSLHLVSANGTVLKSASADSAVFRRQPGRMLGRSLFLINESSFIAAPMHRYRIELWSVDLKLKRIFERSVDWFLPLSDEAMIDIPSRKSLPMQLSSVAGSGSDGIVIAHLFSGSSKFKPDPALATRKGEVSVRESGSGPSLNKYVDTTIEFIELGTSSVLASGRFPGAYALVNQAPGGAHPPLYCIVRETPDGGETLEIVGFDFVGRTSENHFH